MCSLSRSPTQNHCIAFTLHFTATTTRVLVVVSLSPAAKEGNDGYFGVPDDSGVVKKMTFFDLKSGPAVS